jgi:uncharacterized membrane protein YsdA (DUF1294 family)
MSNSPVYGLINGVILGQLLTLPFFQSESFSNSTASAEQQDAVMTFGFAMLGGIASTFVNWVVWKRSKENAACWPIFRTTLLVLALSLWIICNLGIGFVLNPADPTHFFTGASIIFLNFCGGYYYFGTKGLSLRDIRTHTDSPAYIFMHEMIMPVYGLLTNYAYRIYVEADGLAYTHRTTFLLIVTLFIAQGLFLLTGGQEEEEKKEEKIHAVTSAADKDAKVEFIPKGGNVVPKKVVREHSPWGLVCSLLAVFFFYLTYYVPFIVLPSYDPDGQAMLAYLLFGGLLIGKVVACGCVFVKMETVTNVLSIVASLGLVVLHFIWSDNRTYHPEYALHVISMLFGIMGGYLDTWLLAHVVEEWPNVTVTQWMVVFTLAGMPGPFFDALMLNKDPIVMGSLSIVVCCSLLVGLFLRTTT